MTAEMVKFGKEDGLYHVEVHFNGFPRAYTNDYRTKAYLGFGVSGIEQGVVFDANDEGYAKLYLHSDRNITKKEVWEAYIEPLGIPFKEFSLTKDNRYEEMKKYLAA